MIPSAADDQEIRQRLQIRSLADPEQAPKRPNILLATTDLEIRRSMSELLQTYAVNTLRASGMEEIKSTLAKQDVAACFCSFWLVDGTYRDVVRHLRRQRTEIPVIIVCAPTCPHEYRDYLAALNIRAFDFICHPYRQSDLERILYSAMALRNPPSQMPTSVVKSSDSSFGSSELRRAS